MGKGGEGGRGTHRATPQAAAYCRWPHARAENTTGLTEFQDESSGLHHSVQQSARLLLWSLDPSCMADRSKAICIGIIVIAAAEITIMEATLAAVGTVA